LAQSEAANRLKKVKPSGIRRMSLQVNNVPEVISLGIGEPDFSPPTHVLDAAKQALDEGKTHYTQTTGIPELLEALAKKAKKDYGLSYDPNTEILVTVGGTQAIFLALQALINPGDEVIISDPCFVCYEPSVYIAGGVPASTPLLEKDGFTIDKDAVISHLTRKSRMLLINSPNNPTGSVFSHADLSNLAKIVNERNLLVISDEVYEKITYDDARHYCFAGFPDMRERTIVVGSFSKTYAMTGFRVGYVYGPQKLIAPMKLAHYFNVACVNASAQYAALSALNGPQDFIKNMVVEFDRRRKLVYTRLKEIEGFQCSLPKGAFYAFPNIEDFGTTSEKFAEYMVNRAKVITVPGSAFGKHGEGYLRVSYATAYDQIEEALNRIEKVTKTFKKT
jgi:aminotransferase